jgi:hypothetical protein
VPPYGGDMVAWIALVLSLVSLGLQWWIWRRTGPVVRFAADANYKGVLRLTISNAGRS